MKRLILAAAAAALVAPGATAATGTCLQLSDPAGDVRAHEALPALPAGTANEIDAIDLVSVEAEATTGDAVRASFTVAGWPEPRTGMRHSYWMRFHDADYDFALFVNLGNVVNWPVSTAYGIEVTHRASGQTSTYSAAATVGFHPRTVTVAAFLSDVPLLHPLDPGRTFTIDSFETYGGAGVLTPYDSVAGTHTLVVGDGCP